MLATVFVETRPYYFFGSAAAEAWRMLSPDVVANPGAHSQSAAKRPTITSSISSPCLVKIHVDITVYHRAGFAWP